MLHKHTGNVQEFTAPSSTTYKLEVWGAAGAMGTEEGGMGGYAIGNKSLNQNNNIYICCGQAGGSVAYPWDDSKAAYNGGGLGQKLGGGATHTATTNRGELYNYEKYKSEVLLVAGGGGGSDWDGGSGGHGGGNVGGDSHATIHIVVGGLGGTQNNGGAGANNGSFGRGGKSAIDGESSGGGGGGGWYGGGGSTNTANSGGGGSGHIGNVSNGSMRTGVNGGSGHSLITWMPVL